VVQGYFEVLEFEGIKKQLAVGGWLLAVRDRIKF
jgi:hypothetical protein